MQNEEIAESLQNGTDEDLQEDLRFANRAINKKPTFPYLADAPRFLERKQEYREYRDLILAEIARRG
jgi:hypothetical protein